MIMTVNTSRATVAMVTRKPAQERSTVILVGFFFISVWTGKAGQVLPRGSAGLKGEGSRCWICLVVVVANSLGVWTVFWGWWVVSEETTFTSTFESLRVCDFSSLQTISEVLVPVIFTPDLHLQEKKVDTDFGNTGHCWALQWNRKG